MPTEKENRTKLIKTWEETPKVHKPGCFSAKFKVDGVGLKNRAGQFGWCSGRSPVPRNVLMILSDYSQVPQIQNSRKQANISNLREF